MSDIKSHLSTVTTFNIIVPTFNLSYIYFFFIYHGINYLHIANAFVFIGHIHVHVHVHVTAIIEDDDLKLVIGNLVRSLLIIFYSLS